MSEGTVDTRKWELVNQKGAAAQLALDGMLYRQDEERIDLQQILDELKNRGIQADSTIPEDQIQQQWRSPEISQEPIDNWSVSDTSVATQLSLF